MSGKGQSKRRAGTAQLYRIGGLDLRRSLVEIGEVRYEKTGGDPGKLLQIAGAAGAEALCSVPLTGYARGAKPDERLLYVRSPETGLWYEHVFEREAHPFVRWRTNPDVEEDKDGKHADPILAGVFYAVANDLHGTAGEEPERAVKRAVWCLCPAFAYEKRDIVEQMVERGMIHKAFGLEARLGELYEELKIMEPEASGVLHVQASAPCFGESVAVFIVDKGRISGRHPYLVGIDENVRPKLEKILEQFSAETEGP